MDNKIFNVNGCSQEMLIQTLTLFLQNNGHTFSDRDRDPKRLKFEGYKIDPEKGFILIGFGIDDNDIKRGQVKFPAPVSIEIAAGMIMAWLDSDEAKKMTLTGWDADAQHDGSNGRGWRVYVDEWGHINCKDDAIHFAVAITPAYMWYGK